MILLVLALTVTAYAADHFPVRPMADQLATDNVTWGRSASDSEFINKRFSMNSGAQQPFGKGSIIFDNVTIIKNDQISSETTCTVYYPDGKLAARVSVPAEGKILRNKNRIIFENEIFGEKPLTVPGVSQNVNCNGGFQKGRWAIRSDGKEIRTYFSGTQFAVLSPVK